MNVNRFSSIALAMSITLLSFNCNAQQASPQSQYVIIFTGFSIEKEDSSEEGKSEYLFYVYDPNHQAYKCIPKNCRANNPANQGDPVLGVEVSKFTANDYVYLMVREADENQKWNVLSQTPETSEIKSVSCPSRGKYHGKACLKIQVQYLLDNPSCLMMATQSGTDEICLFYKTEEIWQEPTHETGIGGKTDTLDESVAGEIKFPSTIKYKILRGGRSVGNAFLEFNKHQPKYGKNIFSLHLGNFTGVGIQSNQTLHTYVEQEALSLYAASLCDGKRCTPQNWVYEIRIKDGLALDLSKTKAYAYKERGDDGTIETVLYSKGKVVDLLSAFLVTSEAVRNAKTGKQKINLFVGNSTKLVDMHVSEAKKRVTLSSGRRVNATAVSIGRYGQVVFRFYISKDTRQNVYFPIKVDMNIERGLALEAIRW